jgi:hypothetical protein
MTQLSKISQADLDNLVEAAINVGAANASSPDRELQDAKRELAEIKSKLEKRIDQLEIIVCDLFGDYIRGDNNGGSVEWEDLDLTFEMAKKKFPDLYEIAEANNPPEDEEEKDEEE